MRKLHEISLSLQKEKVLNAELKAEAAKILIDKFEKIDNNFAILKKEIEKNK